MWRFTLVTLIFIVLSWCSALAQEEHHEHDHHHHHLGLAIGPTYIVAEKEFAPGIHFHYSRLIDVKEAQFGVGLGLETIRDEHRHYATSLNLSYYPIHNITLTIAPGIQFGPSVREFTTHFEGSYEFIFGAFHLGPALEYAYAKNDAHAMLGLHLGYGI